MAVPEDIRLADRRRWMDGGAFVGPDGSPRVWLHGTDFADFNVFCRNEEFSLGYHFGGVEAANARLKDIFGDELPEADASIIPVICRGKNPLRLKDHYTWSFRNVVSELVDLGVITDDEADLMMDLGDNGLFAAIELAGYDCVVYLNRCEHKEEATDSLMVWRANLLKSPFASSFDLDDPRLMPQRDTDAADLRAHEFIRDGIETAKQDILSHRSKPALSA